MPEGYHEQGKLKIVECEVHAEGKLAPTDSFHVKLKLGQYHFSVPPKQLKDSTGGKWIVGWGEGSRLLDMKDSVCNVKPDKLDSASSFKIEVWCFSETGNDLCMGSAKLQIFEPELSFMQALRLSPGPDSEKNVSAILQTTEDGEARGWSGKISLRIAAKPYSASPSPSALHPEWKSFWRVWFPGDVKLLWQVDWAKLAKNELTELTLLRASTVVAEVLGSALAKNTSLKLLDLSDNQIEEGKAAASLINTLGTLPLETFRFNNTPDVNLFSLALPILAKSSTLHSLSLSGCELEDEHLPDLVALLQKNLLVHLDLSSNHISDDGVAALAPALPLATKLVELNLSSNEIDNDGFKELMNSLQKAEHLRRLPLDANIFEPKAAQKFRALIKERGVLEVSQLDLDQEQAEEADNAEMERLAAEIAKDKELRRQAKDRLALEKQQFLEKQAKREQRHNQLRERRAALNKNISDLDKKLAKWKTQLGKGALHDLSSDSDDSESSDDTAPPPTLEQRRAEIRQRANARRQRKSKQY